MADLEKIWNRVDEERDSHETSLEAAESEESEAYHRGWVDAMKWVLEIMEPLVCDDTDYKDW